MTLNTFKDWNIESQQGLLLTPFPKPMVVVTAKRNDVVVVVVSDNPVLAVEELYLQLLEVSCD